jgi:hypothetical protein
VEQDFVDVFLEDEDALVFELLVLFLVGRCGSGGLGC